jgi:hypothetical protein
VESDSKSLKTNNRSAPQCADFYLALLIGGSSPPIERGVHALETTPGRWSRRVIPARVDA